MTKLTSKLAEAVAASDWDHVLSLLAQDNDILINAELESKMGYTLLHLACLNNQIDIVKALLNDPRLDINHPDHSGQSVLHLVTHFNEIPLLELLTQDPYLDVNHQDHDGLTPLHLAMYQSLPDAALLLIKTGANPRITDFEGQTPGDIALYLCRDDMYSALQMD